MKVTAIRQQVKNSERVSIYVDGRYSFSLTINQLVSSKLRKDSELTPEDIAHFKKLSEEGKFRMRAHEWLTIRPHSHKEFGDYLRRKNVDPAFQLQLIEWFEKIGLLDDRRFASFWIDSRLRKLKSRRYIVAELAQKGIPREMSSELLDEVGQTEDKVIKDLIEKKQRMKRYQENPDRLTQYLLRQGYSYNLIKKALNR